MSEARIRVTRDQALAIAQQQRCLAETTMGRVFMNLAPADIWVENRAREIMENGAEQCEIALIKL